MNIILIEKEERSFSSFDERYIHIKRILSLKNGDSFKCGIINGEEGIATITNFDDKSIDFTFKGERDGSYLYPLTLIVAQTRPICMKRILREAVSLGVKKLILPLSDKGEKSYRNSSFYTSGEYYETMKDGAMQSGHTGVSEIVVGCTVEEAIEEASRDCNCLLLLDNVIGAESLSSLSLEGKSVALAIGPERGWSERERELFLSSSYLPTLIGKRILRTETCVSASVSVALSRMGLI